MVTCHIYAIGDDLVNRKNILIKEIMRIFDEFASISGLKISLEKPVFYFVGISEQRR